MREATPQIRTTILISPEFYSLCKKNGIKFVEALRVGISLMLAEKGIKEYDNNLNISRRITLLTEQLEKTSNELEELKKKQDESNNTLGN